MVNDGKNLVNVVKERPLTKCIFVHFLPCLHECQNFVCEMYSSQSNSTGQRSYYESQSGLQTWSNFLNSIILKAISMYVIHIIEICTMWAVNNGETGNLAGFRIYYQWNYLKKEIKNLLINRKSWNLPLRVPGVFLACSCVFPAGSWRVPGRFLDSPSLTAHTVHTKA